MLTNALGRVYRGRLGAVPTGVIVASLLIGYAQILTAAYLGTHWMMIVSLLAILVILAVKPSGLFGHQKELEERI